MQKILLVLSIMLSLAYFDNCFPQAIDTTDCINKLLIPNLKTISYEKLKVIKDRELIAGSQDTIKLIEFGEGYKININGWDVKSKIWDENNEAINWQLVFNAYSLEIKGRRFIVFITNDCMASGLKSSERWHIIFDLKLENVFLFKSFQDNMLAYSDTDNDGNLEFTEIELDSKYFYEHINDKPFYSELIYIKKYEYNDKSWERLSSKSITCKSPHEEPVKTKKKK